MSNITQKQGGFSIIEAVLILGVVALVGFLGWTFYQTMTEKNKSADTVETTSTDGVSPKNSDTQPVVESTKDLDKAEQFLNDTDVDKDLNTTEIDNALE